MSDLQGLYTRRELALLCIRTVSETSKDDPRRESALQEYNRQLAEIDRKITELTGTPPPVVIGLKTASLSAKVQK